MVVVLVVVAVVVDIGSVVPPALASHCCLLLRRIINIYTIASRVGRPTKPTLRPIANLFLCPESTNKRNQEAT